MMPCTSGAGRTWVRRTLGQAPRQGGQVLPVDVGLVVDQPVLEHVDDLLILPPAAPDH